MSLEEQYDNAWRLLTEKGLSLTERVNVRNGFTNKYKNEYPFIAETKGYFHSTYDSINYLCFDTKQEVIIANAVFNSMKTDNFNHEEFKFNIKCVFRILGIKSDWN